LAPFLCVIDRCDCHRGFIFRGSRSCGDYHQNSGSRYSAYILCWFVLLYRSLYKF